MQSVEAFTRRTRIAFYDFVDDLSGSKPLRNSVNSAVVLIGSRAFRAIGPSGDRHYIRIDHQLTGDFTASRLLPLKQARPT